MEEYAKIMLDGCHHLKVILYHPVELIRSLFTIWHLTSKNFYNSLKFHRDSNLLPFLYANGIFSFLCVRG